LPLLTLVTCLLSLPAIGVRWRALGGAIAPGLAASAAMAGLVWLVDGMLPPLAPPARLALLVGTGGSAYLVLLFLFARATLDELVRLVIRRKPATAQMRITAKEG